MYIHLEIPVLPQLSQVSKHEFRWHAYKKNIVDNSMLFTATYRPRPSCCGGVLSTLPRRQCVSTSTMMWVVRVYDWYDCCWFVKCCKLVCASYSSIFVEVCAKWPNLSKRILLTCRNDICLYIYFTTVLTAVQSPYHKVHCSRPGLVGAFTVIKLWTERDVDWKIVSREADVLA